ncbi:MAG: hypothetical protein IKA23_03775 [Akkermansia sp.]|nr:hypothetical protein [Akkermansia sp.]
MESNDEFIPTAWRNFYNVARKINPSINENHPSIIRFLDDPFSMGDVRHCRKTTFRVLSKAELMQVVGLSESDIEQASPELQQALDEEYSLYCENVKEEARPVQFPISLPRCWRNVFETFAKQNGMTWGDLVVSMAIDSLVGWISTAEFAHGQTNKRLALTGAYPIEAPLPLITQGWKMRNAFKPEEVAQAMDVAGITPSQAVKLMAELERLRDARMNPEA